MEIDTETAILDAAAVLLETQGHDGLTTRAVCERAGVKAPTLYHHFGDKEGLERALIQRGLAEFMRRKRAPRGVEQPLQALRFGWDVAVQFALEQPALSALFARHVLAQPELVAEPYAVMRGHVQRLVDTGSFRPPVDAAARAVWAASQGVIALARPGARRKEVEETSELIFDAVVAALSTRSA